MARHFTVRTGHQVLAYTDGVLTGVRGPGRYRPTRRTQYQLVDIREMIMTVTGQEVPTSEGINVKVSVAVRHAIVDPRAWAASADPQADVHLAVQIALRDHLPELAVDELTATARRSLAETMTESVTVAAARVGIAVHDLVIKDIVLPANLRESYTDQVTARQRGLAKLEEARAETAVLRSLANGAKLLDEHPTLARIRTLEAVPYGAKVVLHLDGSAEG